jgi:hypothetical protein
MKTSWAIALALAVVGCGGESFTVASYLAQQDSAVCDREVRCGAFDSHDTCVALIAQQDTLGLVNVQHLADLGLIVIDDANAHACLDSIERASCVDDGHFRDKVPACGAVFRGTKHFADPCFQGLECDSGTCEPPVHMCAPGACCAGTCGPIRDLPAAGAPCSSRGCAAGSYCDSTGTCAALHGAGQPCTASTQCAFELVCAGATNGTCQPPPRAGDPCLPVGTASSCSTTGLSCDGTDGRCKDLSGAYGSCGNGLHCASDLACELTVCRPLPVDGETCTEEFGCAAGFFCSIQDHKCAPLGANGAPCGTGADCQSAYCTRMNACDDSPSCE